MTRISPPRATIVSALALGLAVAVRSVPALAQPAAPTASAPAASQPAAATAPAASEPAAATSAQPQPTTSSPAQPGAGAAVPTQAQPVASQPTPPPTSGASAPADGQAAGPSAIPSAQQTPASAALPPSQQAAAARDAARQGAPTGSAPVSASQGRLQTAAGGQASSALLGGTTADIEVASLVRSLKDLRQELTDLIKQVRELLAALKAQTGSRTSPGSSIASCGQGATSPCGGKLTAGLTGGSDLTPLGPPGTVLLQDNMDDPANGWLPRSSSSPTKFLRGYQAGEYVIQRVAVDDPKVSGGTAFLPGTYSDTTLAVDARLVAPTDNRAVALLCRHGPNIGYRGVVQPDRGIGWIRRFDGPGVSQLLVPARPSGAIHRGAATNHIELTCAGTIITLTVNGVVVARAEDFIYDQGQSAVLTSVLGLQGAAPGPVEAHFDNLSLTVAGPGGTSAPLLPPPPPPPGPPPLVPPGVTPTAANAGQEPTGTPTPAPAQTPPTSSGPQSPTATPAQAAVPTGTQPQPTAQAAPTTPSSTPTATQPG